MSPFFKCSLSLTSAMRRGPELIYYAKIAIPDVEPRVPVVWQEQLPGVRDKTDNKINKNRLFSKHWQKN